MIEIKKINNNTFEVHVSTQQGDTSHEVSVSDECWQDLTGDKISKEDLVKKSFDFLLERESNQSILKSFDLMDINKYFPEFSEVIKHD